MTNLFAGVLAEAQRIESTSTKRLREAGEGGIATTAVMMHFESPRAAEPRASHRHAQES